MRSWLLSAVVVLAASCLVGETASAQGYLRGGFGYGPSLGGFNSQYMVPGYPYYGNGRPSNYVGNWNGSSGRRGNVVVRPQTVRPSGDGLPIKIINPMDAGAAVHYSLNDYDYVIEPGQSQTIVNDRPWTISFDRGGDFGPARYSMSPGTYTFAATDKGWQVYHDADVSKVQPAAPPRPQ
jgi:hypothetical protein